MIINAKQSRQPTPGARLGCISALVARRGCADRWVWDMRQRKRQ
jgi:hypothetical protein